MSRLACNITRQKCAIWHCFVLKRNDRRSFMAMLSDQKRIHINREVVDMEKKGISQNNI